MASDRFRLTFARWLTPQRSQSDLAARAGVSPGSISRVLSGTIRLEPETLARILVAVAGEDPVLAKDMLQDYLLDTVPAGLAPDGREWADHVTVVVDNLAHEALRMQETPAAATDEVDEALAYIAKLARESRHGQQFVLSFYRLRHPKATNYYGLPKPGA